MAEDTGQSIVKQLQQKHDVGVAQLGSEDLASEVTGYISTQNPMIDFMIMRPGIPRGSMTLIIGQEGAGKSSLVLHILAETQMVGGLAVLADTENRLWTPRARDIGVDTDNLLHLTPVTLEELLALVEEVIDFGREDDPDKPITIAIDSVAGVPTKSDVESLYGKGRQGGHAHTMSLAMRKLGPKIARTNVALICVNQLRHKLDFGAIGRPKMTMIAEKPLNYWARLKIGMDHAGIVGDKQQPTGIKVRMSIIESRISPALNNPHVIDLDLRHGFDFMNSALDVLVEVGAINASGAGGWFQYDGGKKFHRSDFPEIWESHPELEQMVKAAPELWTPKPGDGE